MSEVTDIMELWMDTTYPATFPRRRSPRLRVTGNPEVVTAPRKSWHECLEARVRYALKYMQPDSRIRVEGVWVERCSYYVGQQMFYTVNGIKAADFAEAVAAVCAAVGTAEGV